MRLNRFLATAGLGSRRGVEELIEKGRVRVNGTVVTDLATKVKPTDVIKVGNKVVRPEHTIHAVINKPRGYVCSADDEQDRRTIYELLPPNWPRVFHVGRLDMESEGLLIMTNDGDLSLALTHPKYKVPKEYEVVLDRPFDPAHSEKLLRGFHIIGGRAKMEAIELISGRRLRLVLHQGIKRQIRLMMYEMGYEVDTLKRLRIGSVELGNMPTGACRLLTPAEVDSLRAATSPAGTKAPTARTITAGFKDLRPADRRGKGPSKRIKPPAREEQPTATAERAPSREKRADSRPERASSRPERPGARGPRSGSTSDRPPGRVARKASKSSRPAEQPFARFAKPSRSVGSPRYSEDGPETSDFERGANRAKGDAPRFNRDASRGKGDAPRFNRDASRAKGEAPRLNRATSREKGEEPRFNRGSSREKRDDPRFDRGASREKRGDNRGERTAPRGPRPATRDKRDAPRDTPFTPRFAGKASSGNRAPAGRARPPRPGGSGPAKPRAPRGR